MTDYVTSLETALRDAAAREYPVRDERAESVPGTSPGRWAAPIRWRVRCGAWWRSPLALLLVVLAGASTAAAIVALNWNSAPLTGSVPGLAGRLRFDIPLTPDREPEMNDLCRSMSCGGSCLLSGMVLDRRTANPHRSEEHGGLRGGAALHDQPRGADALGEEFCRGITEYAHLPSGRQTRQRRGGPPGVLSIEQHGRGGSLGLALDRKPACVRN